MIIFACVYVPFILYFLKIDRVEGESLELFKVRFKSFFKSNCSLPNRSSWTSDSRARIDLSAQQAVLHIGGILTQQIEKRYKLWCKNGLLYL